MDWHTHGHGGSYGFAPFEERVSMFEQQFCDFVGHDTQLVCTEMITSTCPPRVRVSARAWKQQAQRHQTVNSIGKNTSYHVF